MRILLQRVRHASVSVEKQVVGAIQKGILALAGIAPDDTAEDIDWLAAKLVNLRIFDDAEGVMNRSVIDIGGDILLVSQFTLYASTRKGNRPSYSGAARPEAAIPLFESFHQKLEQLLSRPVSTGRFGAQMKIELLNDGPVTLWLDSRQRE